MIKDVTNLIKWSISDGEILPITKCICGVEFRYWGFIISIYPDEPSECPNCFRKFFFKSVTTVFEVKDDTTKKTTRRVRKTT